MYIYIAVQLLSAIQSLSRSRGTTISVMLLQHSNIVSLFLGIGNRVIAGPTAFHLGFWVNAANHQGRCKSCPLGISGLSLLQHKDDEASNDEDCDDASKGHTSLVALRPSISLHLTSWPAFTSYAGQNV